MELNRLDDLVAGYLSGSLGDDDLRELTDLAETDPAVARLVAQHVVLDRVLGSARRRSDAAAIVAALPPDRADLIDRHGSRPRRSSGSLSSQSSQRRWQTSRRGLRMVEGTRSRRTLMFAAASVLALVGIAAATTYMLVAPKPIARFASAEFGTVLLRGEQLLPAHAGEEIYVGDVIQCHDNASAAFAYADGTRLTLRPGVELAIEPQRPRIGKALTLRVGAITASVAPQLPGAPLVIRTPQARATVIGTAFTLSVPTAVADRTVLDVDHGRVRLERLADHLAVEVATGQYAVAKPGTPMEPRERPAGERYEPTLDGYAAVRAPSVFYGEHRALQISGRQSPIGELVGYLQFFVDRSGVIDHGTLALTVTDGQGVLECYRVNDLAWEDDSSRYLKLPARDPLPFARITVEGPGRFTIPVPAGMLEPGRLTIAVAGSPQAGFTIASHESGETGPVLDVVYDRDALAQ
jgi:hypothetical protein